MSPKRRVHISGVCLFLSILSVTTSGSVIEPPFPEERSRHLYWLARNEHDEQRRLRLYEEGRAVGEAALSERPGESGAILWWAANEGAIAEAKKNLGSLVSLKKIEKALLGLREKDPAYGFAAADRVLGNIYRKAPKFISIGSARKAEMYLRDAVRRCPDFPGNSLALADFLLEKGENGEARRLALAVARNPLFKHAERATLGDFALEKDDWQAVLETVLEKTEGKKP